MNVQDRSGVFDLNKYGVGQPVRRTEDPVLVQGRGRYTDDLSLPGQLWAVRKKLPAALVQVLREFALLESTMVMRMLGTGTIFVWVASSA